MQKTWLAVTKSLGPNEVLDAPPSSLRRPAELDALGGWAEALRGEIGSERPRRETG